MPTTGGSGNVVEASAWLQRAVAAGEADAAYELGRLRLDEAALGRSEYEEAEREAVSLFGLASRGGLDVQASLAMFNLGIAHLTGWGGIRANVTTAALWFEASGEPEGMAAASMLHHGEGREAEAARWMRRAENNGYSQAWRRQYSAARLHNAWRGAGGLHGPLAPSVAVES